MTRDIDKVNGWTIRKLTDRTGAKVYGYLQLKLDGDRVLYLQQFATLKQARENAQIVSWS